MKLLKLLIVLLTLANTTILSECKESPTASIEWEETSIDLGDLEFNKASKAEFVFKNPGMIPLMISEVKPSCGCTVADFPKHPIVGGSSEKIIITYDAKSEGYFSKTITVFTNTSGGLTKLYIKGQVVK